MNLLDPVSEIMTTNVFTVEPNTNFQDIEELFKSTRVHHLPVLEAEKLVGMVSKSDYLFYKRGNIDEEVILKNNEKIKVQDLEARHFMTRGLAKLEPEDRINIALEIFKENLFHAILVVKDGELKGILSTYDIIFHLANDMEASQKYTFK